MKNKLIRFIVLLVAGGAGAGVTAQTERAATTVAAKERIGIYDSRSVAIAFVASDAGKRWMAALNAEHERAKAAGDAKRVKELEAEGKARQEKLHTQGFSTAPVDDYLKEIQDQLPALKKQAGVTLLVSKWDKRELAKHKSAEKVDVTPALVEAFKVNEKTRKSALDIQNHKPIPLSKAKRLKD